MKGYYERMKEYYDRRAPEYDESIPGETISGPGGDRVVARPEVVEERPSLLGAVSGLPPARVLDVGCGTGFFTRHLKGEVTGLDQSEAMLKIARGRVPWAIFVRGDALQMPCGDRSFDRVFASSFYGLLGAPERERFLGEARRVAAEEIVLVEPTPVFGPSGRLEALEERILSDGSRFRIYRRYFEAEGLAAEIDGRVLFAGRWAVMAAARA